ncbi:hypothetical protein NDU88_001144 [Pleurodeles waltl]|uniref:Uncharacterized protein n=1 Tax=Pleurodeles waltl TaxID=8319 RepID=A0AAV7R9E1_PLEWA|nr:hypothetical protein NDU88_001144 [Pleurodeles waltl]
MEGINPRRQKRTDTGEEIVKLVATSFLLENCQKQVENKGKERQRRFKLKWERRRRGRRLLDKRQALGGCKLGRDGKWKADNGGREAELLPGPGPCSCKREIENFSDICVKCGGASDEPRGAA